MLQIVREDDILTWQNFGINNGIKALMPNKVKIIWEDKIPI